MKNSTNEQGITSPLLKRSIRISGLTLAALFCISLYDGQTAFAKTPHLTTKVQQATTITGKVTDNQDTPLSNVTIQDINTQSATNSDANGEFTLRVDQLPTSIEVRIVGYQTQIIEIKDSRPLQITLEEDISDLEEVVVVGYGKQ